MPVKAYNYQINYFKFALLKIEAICDKLNFFFFINTSFKNVFYTDYVKITEITCISNYILRVNKNIMLIFV